MKAILDASALLAYLHREPGWETVEACILAGQACVSPVNLAEAAAKLIDHGLPPDDALAALAILQLPELPYASAEANETARLRPLTRSRGLSLGDRACLASARCQQLAVLTADRPWLELAEALQLEIRYIRPVAGEAAH
jgi:PIN domain nuclease of toxin-antitoxin system